MIYSFHPAAEAEHLEQVAWYEGRQTALGVRYHEHFVRSMRRVCEAPGRYPIERSPDIRRMRLALFPLTVVFRERDGVIEVLAVAHYRRRPQYWLGRTASREQP
jgi:toxin ParE1/3/4